MPVGPPIERGASNPKKNPKNFGYTQTIPGARIAPVFLTILIVTLTFSILMISTISITEAAPYTSQDERGFHTRSNDLSLTFGSDPSSNISASMVPGETWTVDGILRNSGSSASDPSMILVVGNPGNWNITTVPNEVGSIQPDSEIKIELVVRSPYDNISSAEAGSFDIQVMSGTGFSNISAVVTLHLELDIRADLQTGFDLPGIVDGTLNCAAGSSVVGWVEVKNYGNAPDRASLRIVDQPLEWTVLFGNGYTDDSSWIAPGEISRFRLTLEIPATASDGPAGELMIIVRSHLGDLEGIQRGPWEQALPCEALSGSYIYANVQDQTVLIQPGQTRSVLVSLTNLAPVPIDYSPNITVSTPSMHHTFVLEVQQTTLSIPPGKSVDLTVLISCPDDAWAGNASTMILGGTATPMATVIGTELEAIVDQVYEMELDIPQNWTAIPGEHLIVPVEGTNLGNGEEQLLFRIMEEPLHWNAWVSPSVKKVSPGKLDGTYIHIILPYNSPSGPYHLNITVEALRGDMVTIRELTLRVVVEDYVDISMDPAEIWLEDQEDGGYRISITLFNNGRTDAGNTTVIITPVTRSGSELDPISATGLNVPAGGECSALLVWDGDPSVDRLLISAQVTGYIRELSPDDNQLSIMITPEHLGEGDGDIDTDGDGGLFSTQSLGATVVTVVVVSGLLGILITVFNTEHARWSAWSAMMPLYSKLKEGDVLTNENREKVYNYVQNNPGDHFRSILYNLEMTNGTLSHHLHTLEKREMIKSERDGPFKRFYPRGRSFSSEVLEVNGVQGKILNLVAINPGITQKQIAKKFDLSPPTVNYHVKSLINAGLIRVQREGKFLKLYRESEREAA